MKSLRPLAVLLALLSVALPARAQDELRVNHTTRQPTSPVNLSGSNVTGTAFDAAGAAAAVAAAAPKLPPAAYFGANWIYASFNDATSPGETLNLSYSQNGTAWTPTTPNYTAPTGNGVRDCSIIYLNGVYYIAYTAGNFGQVDYVQVCQSTDLVNWTYLCNVNTQTLSQIGQYTWAPEWFVDRDGTVYLFFARSEYGGVWRIFYVTATNLTLTAWSAPQALTGDMAGQGAIDPQVVRDGDTYYILFRNYGSSSNSNNTSSNDIEIAQGTSPTAFTLFRTGNWAGWGTGEGPSLLHLGGSRWRLYFQSLGPPEVNEYSDSFDGMNTWSAPVATGLPQHGTVLALNDNAGSKNIPSVPTSVVPAATIIGTASLPGEASPGAIGKIALNTVVTDNMGWWNTSNARYIPQKAGRYLVQAFFSATVAGMAGTFWDLGISLNGVSGPPLSPNWTNRLPSSASYGPYIIVSAQIACNGSTDFIELWGGQGSGGALAGSERLEIVYVGPN